MSGVFRIWHSDPSAAFFAMSSPASFSGVNVTFRNCPVTHTLPDVPVNGAPATDRDDTRIAYPRTEVAWSVNAGAAMMLSLPRLLGPRWTRRTQQTSPCSLRTWFG